MGRALSRFLESFRNHRRQSARFRFLLYWSTTSAATVLINVLFHWEWYDGLFDAFWVSLCCAAAEDVWLRGRTPGSIMGYRIPPDPITSAPPDTDSPDRPVHVERSPGELT